MKIVRVENCVDCPNFEVIQNSEGIFRYYECVMMGRKIQESLKDTPPEWCPLGDYAITN